MKICGIYKIMNIITEHVYIGSSINIKARLASHASALKNNNHYNSHLQRSWNKYGKENFSTEIIEIVPEEILLIREKYWIDFFKSDIRNFGFNLKSDPFTKRHSEETKQKMSKSHIGKTISRELVEKLRLCNLGRKQSKESISKMLDTKKRLGLFIPGRIKKKYKQKSCQEKCIDCLGKRSSKYCLRCRACSSKRRIGIPTTLGIKRTNESIQKQKNSIRMKNIINGKIIVCIETGEEFLTSIEAGKKFNCHKSNINACLNGKQKTSRGHSFKYKNAII
jgi:group I intron endonuclease